MKMLHVTIGSTVIRFTDPAQFAGVIAALAEATIHEKDWNGEMTAKPTPIGLEFVDPAQTADNPAVSALKKEVDQFRGWWSDCNTKTAELTKQVGELKTQLAAAIAAKVDTETAPAGRTTMDLRG